MARARNIKPGFFSNDELVELPFETRLLFIGLWTIADRAGRILDRPKKIKMDIFPGDSVDVDQCLCQLASSGFILRYQAMGVKAIQVIKWEKHQNPHIKEALSTIPFEGQTDESTIKEQCLHDTSTVQEVFLPERAGLIPDSLNLIPDSGSLMPEPLKSNPVAPAVAVAAEKKPRKEVKAAPGTGKVWVAYATAYWNRYGVEPVRNAMVNGQLSSLVKRIGFDDAEHVAAFFVGHQHRYYVEKMHSVGLLLADCEKLRTEWATSTQMTQAKASQADKTATNLDAFAPLIAAAKAREEAERNRNGQ